MILVTIPPRQVFGIAVEFAVNFWLNNLLKWGLNWKSKIKSLSISEEDVAINFPLLVNISKNDQYVMALVLTPPRQCLESEEIVEFTMSQKNI